MPAHRRDGPAVPAAPASKAEGPLALLTAPIAVEAFLRDHYERAPLVNEGEPGRFDALLSLAQIDRYVTEADLRDPMLLLANHQSPVPRDTYIAPDGRIDAAAVASEYSRGSTIVLNELHESLPSLGAFCRRLEESLSAQVTTNAYLTPPGNQGFPPHYDNHDVFVLQLSGRKLWRLWEAAIDAPYRGERFEQSGFAAGQVSREFVLEPGDCAYIPRGLMHDAENVGDEPSLHVTVGLFTRKWAELLLEAISELALDEPAFRASLPPGFATREFDRAAARDHFDRLLMLVADGAGMDGAFDLLADSFLRGRRADVRGVVRHGPARSGDRFRSRPFLPWNLAEDEERRIVLVGPGGDVSFGSSAGDALERALSGEPFEIADLDAAEGDALVSALWSQGCLEREES